MSDRGSIDKWRRDQDNSPINYDRDVASPEFAAAPRPRRKSILVDPNDRARRPRPAARRNSQTVRLQPSDDEQDRDYEPVRRPPIGSQAHRAGRDMSSRHDLEAKNGTAHRKFREKRDGYESDEGETLRSGGGHRGDAHSPRPRQRPREYDDDAYGGYARGGGERGNGDRPRRRDPRDVDPRDIDTRSMPRPPPVEYGDAPLHSRGYGGGEDPRMRRAQSHREPGRRPPPAYEDDYSDDYRPPPRRMASQRERGGSGRRVRYDPRMDDYDDPRDAGYRSDQNGRRARGPRYDDYYSDGGHARGPNRPPPYYDEDRRDYYGDDRRYSRRDSYGGGYGRDRRSRDTHGKKKDGWQGAATEAFKTYAVPYISRLAREEFKNYMAKQGKR